MVPLCRVYEEHYAVYFPVMTEPEWNARRTALVDEQERQREIDAATLDAVAPGHQQPEIEYAWRAERSKIEEFADRKCRVASDGGWFSYQTKCDRPAPTTLVATYWGGVWHERAFDVLVDDQELATQRLFRNRIGEFFGMHYPIPTAWTDGKNRITVRFQSHPNDVAGALFGLRTVRAKGAGDQQK